jgi:rare lipoprotein A
MSLRRFRSLIFWRVVPLRTSINCSSVSEAPAGAADEKPDECGLASLYSNLSEKTASGEDTQAEDSTAAHRALPFGTLVHVAYRANGRWAVVRITDRGPFIEGRIIDVSRVAARQLGSPDLAARTERRC